MTKLEVGQILRCTTVAEWEAWLSENHATEKEIWLRLARKGRDIETVKRSEALDVALCYGWIDGQAQSIDADFWVQRFTPRTPRSKWSKINCASAEALIQSGRMKAAGMAAVEAAKADGRWDAAYAPPSSMEVPEDLREALSRRPKAEAFFEGLSAQNRYSILYRIHDAKKPETRARRIAGFVEMLERGETLH